MAGPPHPYTLIAVMAVKSVFTLIFYIKDNKVLNLAPSMCRDTSGTKGLDPIFQVWVEEKKGGNRNSPNFLGGTKGLVIHCV